MKKEEGIDILNLYLEERGGHTYHIEYFSIPYTVQITSKV